ANDVMAYIPSLRVLKEGGYEGGGAMVIYGLPTVWGPRVEELIVAAAHAQAKKVREAKDASERGQKERAKLQGHWCLGGGPEGDHVSARKADEKEGLEISIKGNELILRRRDQVLVVCRISLDPEKNPKEMDLHFVKAKQDGQVCLAIYALSGDQLKICTNTKLRPTAGEPRPTVFSTQAQAAQGQRPGILLLVLERRNK